LLFNSTVFFVFFAIFFVLYFLTHGRVRMALMLVASYVFYGWWDWRFLFLIAFSTLVDYWAGLRISRTEDARKRKRLLMVSLVCNLGMLGFFKYFNFFIDSTATFLHLFGMQANLPTCALFCPSEYRSSPSRPSATP